MPPHPVPRTLLVSLLFFVSSSLVSAGAAQATVAGSWASLGPDGSSVSVLASSAGSPNVIYAGRSGAVFKSVDGGATWSRADRGLDLESGVFTIAVNPLHPSTLYAAQNKGLYKSVNGGAAWKQTSLGSAQAPVVVLSLAIHPRLPETVFAGTESGLYRSSNGGATWQLLTQGLPPAPVQAVSVVIDPTSPRRMFASFLELPAFEHSLFSSLDGGSSWQLVPGDSLAIQSLAIDPRSPKSLWAITQNGLFRSTDEGRSWTLSLQAQIFPPISGLAFPSKQKNLIYAGGHAGLFRSLDGGATWSPLSQGLPTRADLGTFLASSATTLIVDVDSPPRDAGLYRSTDGGTSWVRSYRGLTADADSLEVDAEDSNTLWTIVPFKVLKSTDRGRTWSPLPLPPGIGDRFLSTPRRIALSPVDPETALLWLVEGQTWRSRDGGQNWVTAAGVEASGLLKADPLNATTFWAGGFRGIKKSTDGGDTWTPVPLPEANNFFSDLAFSPSSPSTIYAGGNTGNPDFKALLLRSDDAGASWTPAQEGLFAGVSILAVDPQHPEIVYSVPLNGGDIYKTVNGGGTWSVVSSAFHARTVQILTAAPSGVLYAAVQTDNVYESEDGGLSWSPLGASPRPASFSSVIVDPKDSCRIYAGTSNRGVLVFTKRGTAVCP